MTIPSAYQRTVTGSGGTRVGGNAIGVTTATSIITDAMPLKDSVVNGSKRIMEAKVSTGGAYEARTAKSGKFAYNATATQVIGPLMTSALNGTTNTSLKFTSSSNGQNRKIVKPVGKQFGAKILTAWSEYAWTPLGIANQRSNWNSAAASVTSGILSTLTGTSFLSTTNNGNPAADNAAGGPHVPGKLSYLTGAKNPVSDEYPEFTGP